jgi:hypothetical protein
MSRRSIPHAGQSGNPAGRRNVIRNLMTDENTRHVARVIIKPQALEVCIAETIHWIAKLPRRVNAGDAGFRAAPRVSVFGCSQDRMSDYVQQRR